MIYRDKDQGENQEENEEKLDAKGWCCEQSFAT